MSDVLGTATAATLVRRALKHTRADQPELEDLRVAREGLEYRYTVPAAWQAPGAAAPAALRSLARELCRLLRGLTGPVMIRRLASNPDLRRHVLPSELES